MVSWQESGIDGRVWCRLETFYYETRAGDAWSIELWEYAVGGGDAPYVAYAYDADTGEAGPEAVGASGEEALDTLIDVLEEGEEGAEDAPDGPPGA